MFKLGRINEALKYAKKSFNIAKEINYVENIRDASLTLYKTLKKQNKNQESLEMFELYIRMRDSISNQETRKASIKSQLKYEYEKKAAADSVKVAEEKKLTTVKLKQEQTQRYYLYCGLGLTALFGLFMFTRFRVTQKQKSVIEEQKLIVEKQKHIVDEKQKEILDSIRYAKRIQQSLLPTEKFIERVLKINK
jgi:tetratricopeptide (TPR) repeat protein